MRRSLIVLALLLVAGCGREAAPDRVGADGKQPPVVLISIDTLRSDRLPLYGYDAVKTPAIDALRQDGILYERAYSHYPLTLPAHSSVLTGLLPTEHGVRDNLGYPLEIEGIPYLPRMLQNAGYATGATVSAFVLRPETGLGAHFDHYDADIERQETDGVATLGEVQRSGYDTVDAALEWLETVVDRPPFLFFHIYEPHTPYTPPAPFADRYADPYDGEIATADDAVGKLLDGLRAQGLYDEALIFLFSDHGEAFGEHGEHGHGILLYREALQVPLVVKLPSARQAGSTVREPAQLVDVLPTVVDVLGLDVPEALPGHSLLALDELQEPRPIYAETYYPRLHMGWSELTSLIEGPFHLIEGPDPELYDLDADPLQTRSLVQEERRAFRRLRDRIGTYVTELAEPGAVDPETAAQLAALGYLGSSAPTGDGPRPDPKTQIHRLTDLYDALEDVQRADYTSAIPKLERFLASNPEVSDGWQALGLALREQGRWQEAIEAYRRQVELAGPEAHTMLALARLYRRSGDLENAASHAETAVGDNPKAANQVLADIALAREDLVGAERYARAAVAARGGSITPLIALVKVLTQQGKIDEGRATLAEVDRALADRDSETPLPGYHFVRGDLLARGGKTAEGRAAFEAELAAFPDNLDAYARLAFLHAVEGRPGEATATLRLMVETVSAPSAYAAAIRTLRALGDERQAQGLLSHARRLFPTAPQLATL